MIFKKWLLAILFTGLSANAYSSTLIQGVSDNGIEFSLVPMPDNSRVSLQIAWPTQWAFNKDNNQAVPYIAAQLLLAGGAEGYAASEVIERFEDMGSEGYLVPTLEYIIGTVHYSPEHQEDTLDIVNAHLKKPTMDQQWLGRVRDQFANQMQNMPAGAQSFDALRWSVFGDHPAREALSPNDQDTIAAVTQEQTRLWASSVLTRTNPVVVLAGDLDESQASFIVDAVFDGVPESKPMESTPLIADYSPKRLLVHTPDAELSTLSFFGPLPAVEQGSAFADLLLINDLGAGPQSVLFEAVRTELRAAYGYGAGISAFATDHRFMVMSGQVETEKLAEAEKVVIEAYVKFLETSVRTELDDLKAPIQDQIKEAEKDTGSQSYSVLQAIIGKLDWALTTSEYEQLDATTEKVLQDRLTSAFPKPEDLFLLVSSPDAQAIADACVISTPSEAVDC